jgi:hypothetical protein
MLFSLDIMYDDGDQKSSRTIHAFSTLDIPSQCKGKIYNLVVNEVADIRRELFIVL